MARAACEVVWHMNLALGPVLLVMASLLLGGLMSLAMLGLLLLASRRVRPGDASPVQDGTAVAAPER